jgi:UDP-N-acetylmuramoylalanine--D-glutamate ligase
VSGGGFSLNASDPETKRVLVPRLLRRQGIFSICHFDILAAESGVEIIDGGLRLLPSGQTSTAKNPRIVGHHNWQNAASAAALAHLAGLTIDEITAGLDAWPGIAHRLERLGVHRGLTWWNDSKATNVDAAVTALKSFAPKNNVHLIAGGLGKGSPYDPLVLASKNKVRAVYVIGSDASAVKAAFAAAGFAVVESGTMAAAVASIEDAAVDGDHLLLSPACASFDQFRDYGDRGDQLRAAFNAFATKEKP